MRLLIDMSAGWEVADAVRALGHDAAFVRERDQTMPDDGILAWGVAERRLVVTMDKDFGDLVIRDGLAHAGVLLMRMRGARAAEKVAAVTSVLTDYGEQLMDQFAVYQHGQVRFH